MATDNCNHIWLVPKYDSNDILFSIIGKYCGYCGLKQYHNGPMYGWENEPR